MPIEHEPKPVALRVTMQLAEPTLTVTVSPLSSDWLAGLVVVTWTLKTTADSSP